MLNENIDIQKISNDFRQKKRVLIENLLKPDYARACHDSLASQTPWTLRFRYQGKPRELTPQELEQLTNEQKTQFSRDMAQFDFVHYRFAMHELFQQKKHHDLYIYQIYQYLGSDSFLDFLRQVTGIAEIKKRGAMATCFGPGHFLREHDDYQNDEFRLCAYVLNISQEWQPDWGGLLHFLNYDRDIIETFIPKHNSLSLFAVPARHFVSTVAPYAKYGRFSITGWVYPD
ncbi:MAG: 2OG-Fe(II) oxygenase [Gammaproteobacteria bacterium]